jgi:hypothetical protein
LDQGRRFLGPIGLERFKTTHHLAELTLKELGRFCGEAFFFKALMPVFTISRASKIFRATTELREAEAPTDLRAAPSRITLSVVARLPPKQAVPMPAGVDLELGAGFGVPVIAKSNRNDGTLSRVRRS